MRGTRATHGIALVHAIGSGEGRRLLGVQIVGAPTPVNLAWRGRSLGRGTDWCRGSSGRGATPLRSGRSTDTRRLISLGVDVLWLWRRGIVLLGRARQLALEKLQTRLDVNIGRIKVRSPAVGIQGIRNLVVA